MLSNRLCKHDQRDYLEFQEHLEKNVTRSFGVVFDNHLTYNSELSVIRSTKNIFHLIVLLPEETRRTVILSEMCSYPCRKHYRLQFCMPYDLRSLGIIFHNFESLLLNNELPVLRTSKKLISFLIKYFKPNPIIFRFSSF